jgi:hypothetical protein
MPNQKISELTAIVTVDNSVDVLPIVDISANTTKKVTPNALKTALALDNVNNTSDANKPVSIAQQDALNAKVDENAPIVAATKTKITYDAKGLVTAGDILDAADMPTGINAANIGAGAVSSTEFGYLDGVTSAIQTQINSKQATLVSGTNIKTINSTSLLGSGDVAVQPTLVSGTNIKTINSTSLLGSGDITISASPSGVAGAIQFSNGSAFASDAANLFWDDTNKRLGVGTNAPSATVHAKSAGDTNATIILRAQNGSAADRLRVYSDGWFLLQQANNRSIEINPGGYINYQGYSIGVSIDSKLSIGSSAPTTGVLNVRGSGSTSATTSLLVQNSVGTEALRVYDNGIVTVAGTTPFGGYQFCASGIILAQLGFTTNDIYRGDRMVLGNGGGGSIVASAILQADSTTKGFLMPRMTTTQINAIASPANGLEVYNTTLNCPCFYNGTSWRQVTNSAM